MLEIAQVPSFNVTFTNSASTPPQLFYVMGGVGLDIKAHEIFWERLKRSNLLVHDMTEEERQLHQLPANHRGKLIKVLKLSILDKDYTNGMNPGFSALETFNKIDVIFRNTYKESFIPQDSASNRLEKFLQAVRAIDENYKEVTKISLFDSVPSYNGAEDVLNKIHLKLLAPKRSAGREQAIKIAFERKKNAKKQRPQNINFSTLKNDETVPIKVINQMAALKSQVEKVDPPQITESALSKAEQGMQAPFDQRKKKAEEASPSYTNTVPKRNPPLEDRAPKEIDHPVFENLLATNDSKPNGIPFNQAKLDMNSEIAHKIEPVIVSPKKENATSIVSGSIASSDLPTIEKPQISTISAIDASLLTEDAKKIYTPDQTSNNREEKVVKENLPIDSNEENNPVKIEPIIVSPKKENITSTVSGPLASFELSMLKNPKLQSTIFVNEDASLSTKDAKNANIPDQISRNREESLVKEKLFNGSNGEDKPIKESIWTRIKKVFFNSLSKIKTAFLQGSFKIRQEIHRLLEKIKKIPRS